MKNKSFFEKNSLCNTPSIANLSIFFVGLSCMGVAGFFLIEGLSEFAGGAAARTMLVVGGILFQITESVCFISASALTAHSPLWRYILISLGGVLFAFSIIVMTLAQKSALQSGESQALAIDEKRDHLRKQIANLDEAIKSYRFNAEKQSQSIYKDSRALGQDSLNRAIALEENKSALSDTLFRLNESRKHTSADFFARLEKITGLPAQTTEFYFLVMRSLLLELSGIILLSFSANLRANNLLLAKIQASDKTQSESTISFKSTLEGYDLHPSLTHAQTATAQHRQKIIPMQENSIDSPHKPNPTRAPTAKKEILHVTFAAKKSVSPIISDRHEDTQLAPDHYSEPKLDEQSRKKSNQGMEWQNDWASPKIRNKQLKKKADITHAELEILAVMVWDLFEQKIVRGFSRDTIRRALKEHCRKNISNEVASLLSNILKSRQEQTC